MKYIHAQSNATSPRHQGSIAMKAAPIFPIDHLTIVTWPDEMIDRLGHEPHSDYVERYWLGVIGPTASWLLRRITAELRSNPNGFVLDLKECAGEVGIGLRGGQNSPFIRALGRLCQFELAQLQPGGVFAVRMRVPSLAKRHLMRLPQGLQRRHAEWERAQLTSA
jgi:hypothetical protein